MATDALLQGWLGSDEYKTQKKAAKEQGKEITPAGNAVGTSVQAGMGGGPPSLAAPASVDLQGLDGELGPRGTHYLKTAEMVAGVKLAPETQEYYKQLLDPFTFKQAPIGYPSGSDSPTYKQHYFVRGNCFAGPTGCCAVKFSPLIGAASNLGSVQATAASYIPSDRFPTPSEAGTNDFATNSDFVEDGGYADQIAVRIVSAGVKLTYVGQSRLRSGLAMSVVHPSGGALDGITETEIASDMYRGADIKSITDTRESYSAVWSPLVGNDAVTSTTNTSPIQIKAANAGSNFCQLSQVDSFGRQNIGLLLTGCEPSSPFFFEAHVTLEFLGADDDPGDALVQRAATVAPSDPDGLAVIKNSGQSVLANKLPKTSSGALSTENALGWLAHGASAVSSLTSAGKSFMKNPPSYMKPLLGEVANATSLAVTKLPKGSKASMQKEIAAAEQAHMKNGSLTSTSEKGFFESLGNGLSSIMENPVVDFGIDVLSAVGPLLLAL